MQAHMQPLLYTGAWVVQPEDCTQPAASPCRTGLSANGLASARLDRAHVL
jgi:hypothetical protein